MSTEPETGELVLYADTTAYTRVYVVAELSHNHNGDMDRARRMVEAAAAAGADAVKIQCRTLPDAIPPEQRDRPRVVPWTGETMSYLDYRRLCEFTDEQIVELRQLAESCGVDFFASVFDSQQIERVYRLVDPNFYKVPSACITDLDLLRRLGEHARETGATIIASTGAATWDQVDAAVSAIGRMQSGQLWLGQCTAVYPCPAGALNLRAIPELARRYPDAVVGFSNHGVSIAPLVAAVGMGARWLEVHFTLDRTLPGTDQAASFEPQGVALLRRYVDTVNEALGDGVKVPTPEEVETMAKLRRPA